MSNDVTYPLHQNANFTYLTGFIEEDAILLLETIPDKPHPQFKSVLFVQPYDEAAQMWTGFRTGPEDAIDLTGIDEAHPIDKLEEYLAKYNEKTNLKIWGNFMPKDINNMQLHSRYLHRTVSSAIRRGVEIMPVSNFLRQQRLVKVSFDF